MNIEERELHPINGLLMAVAITLCTLACVPLMIYAIATEKSIFFIVLPILGMCIFPIGYGGLKIVQPNEARVMTLFGKYYGTIKEPGFFFVNPFSVSINPSYDEAAAEAQAKNKAALAEGKMTAFSANIRKTISIKTQTLDNGRQKVNDVMGNPIIIGAVVIWKVKDPTRAVFSVENYKEFLSIQTDSTIRNIARLYAYDVFEDDDDDDEVNEKTLHSSSVEIAGNMRDELQQRVENAGLEIIEVRITHLAYAEEIAAAMLQRQQASAIIAARQKIVDGAVSMVKMAINKLGEDEIVVLDEERKAAMVSNLLVVLCGNKDAQPIVNSGTIY